MKVVEQRLRTGTVSGIFYEAFPVTQKLLQNQKVVGATQDQSPAGPESGSLGIVMPIERG